MIVFVVGTARTGSCWLGRLLAAHPQIVGTVEEEPRFGRITRAAIYPNQRCVLVPSLIEDYRYLEKRHGIISEKAHPALWIAEALAEALPGARFLVIEREQQAVIDSMMKHPDVRAHCESGWRDYPEPCPFLGLRKREAYGALSLRERCAQRWKAHWDEVTRLRPILGDRLLGVEYEALRDDPARTLASVQHWLGLSEPFEVVQ